MIIYNFNINKIFEKCYWTLINYCITHLNEESLKEVYFI